MQIVTEEWLTSLIHKHLEHLSQSVWYLLRKLMATKNERAGKWCSGLLRSQTSTQIRGSENDMSIFEQRRGDEFGRRAGSSA